ncbi:CAAX farnesyltransferase (FTase) subunit beta, partial [Dimargaris cristalligena]
LTLNRQSHIDYLNRLLKGVGPSMQSLDSGKPWFSYWSLNSLAMLSVDISPSLRSRTIATLAPLQLSGGGFGGPSQLAHLAATYAAVLALAIVGTEEAFTLIDRDNLYQFLTSMKQPDGSFTAHVGGEIDVRGSYCAMVIAAMTNLLTDELCHNVAEFIVNCQTYEGGIGSHPGVEAHGGYTYCGLAALEILGQSHLLNLPALIKWSAARQMSVEGGFNGRTNKLVDGCYSFWVGGTFPIIEANIRRQFLRAKSNNLDKEHAESEQQLLEQLDYLYDRACCQGSQGGLRDKPEKYVDPYHTCYVLAGLSLCQHHVIDDSLGQLLEPTPAPKAQEDGSQSPPSVSSSTTGPNPRPFALSALQTLKWTVDVVDQCVVGPPTNLLRAVHPVYNIPLSKVSGIFKHFYGSEVVSAL